MPANDLGREKTPQWPDLGFPTDVRNLVDRFYELVDTESEEAFLEGIDQFTADGFTEINENIVRGHSSKLVQTLQHYVGYSRWDMGLRTEAIPAN